MQMLAELIQTAETVNQFVGEVFRMRCGESNTFDPLDIIDPGKQFGKGDLALFLGAIGVDVLADQGDFPHALTGKRAYFIEDFAARTADFTSTDIGHNAVTAIVVTPLHDSDETRVGILSGSRREQLQAGLTIEKVRFFTTNAVIGNVLHQLRQLMDIMSAEDQVQIGELLQ